MQRCEITGTGLISGNQISHSHRLTRRVWKPNLQVTTLNVKNSKRSFWSGSYENLKGKHSNFKWKIIKTFKQIIFKN